MQGTRVLKGFISYSHKDAGLCAALKSCLVGFEREQRIAFWSDHAIDVGDEWHPAIMQQLEAADVAILLLSREFYASEFVWKEELPRARERWEEGKLTVVSVRLRDCYDYKADEYKWLRDVQQVPRDGRVVDGGTRAKRDAAWAEVTREIDRTIDKVLQRREVGIARSGAVDASMADATLTLARAVEIARQINAETIGPVKNSDVGDTLAVAQGALAADAIALRDEVTAAYHRLKRLKFERQDNERLYDHLAQVRAHLMDVIETARDAGYPSRKDVSLPPPKLVPRETVAGEMAAVGRQLDELQARVGKLEAEKGGTSEASALNAAIDGVVEDVGRQGELARGLMAEPLVDLAGVEAAIEGAARAVLRFVRRAIVGTTATVKALAAGIDAAAGALIKVGVALARAVGGVSAQADGAPFEIKVSVRDGQGWSEERRVPGDGVAFRDVLLVKGQRMPGPEMVVVPAGEFIMGSPNHEERCSDYMGEEQPQHRVRIAAPFAIGRFAVTRGEFRAFVEATGHMMPDDAWTFEKDSVFGKAEYKQRKGRNWLNPGFRQDDRHPAVCVSWDDCLAYVAWLNRLISGNEQTPYRLPSEAEWEYACRADTSTPFWWGRRISEVNANYDCRFTYGEYPDTSKYLQRTVSVDNFRPSHWGLYQVHGNVCEWCQDAWLPNYDGAPGDGSPSNPNGGFSRVLRGGSWYNYPHDLRSASRSNEDQRIRDFTVGFRLARTLNVTP